MSSGGKSQAIVVRDDSRQEVSELVSGGQMDGVQRAHLRRPERPGDHQNPVTHPDEFDACKDLASSPSAVSSKIKHRAEDFGARDRTRDEIPFASQEPPQRNGLWLAVHELDERRCVEVGGALSAHHVADGPAHSRPTPVPVSSVVVDPGRRDSWTPA